MNLFLLLCFLLFVGSEPKMEIAIHPGSSIWITHEDDPYSYIALFSINDPNSWDTGEQMLWYWCTDDEPPFGEGDHPSPWGISYFDTEWLFSLLKTCWERLE